MIFTHDTVFLSQLRKEIEGRGIRQSVQYVECRENKAGYVSDGLPWDHQGYKQRIAAHKAKCASFAKLPWPAYPNDVLSMQMRHEYDVFRATIERVVQDFVLNNVVVRFSDWIQPGLLDEVVGLEEREISEIIRLHKRCSGIGSSHDPSSGGNPSVPTDREFKKDIESLEAVISIIKERRAKKKKQQP